MKHPAVLLYGPPASGKDTITATLQQLDPCYILNRRFKVGSSSGRSAGYRLGTRKDLNGMRAAGRILYENERYGNTYAFDAESLAYDLAEGVPVLHVGQLAGVRQLKTYPADWLSVALWCSRATAKARATARGSTDVKRRLIAWDETASDFAAATAQDFDLRIDTDTTTPVAAAMAIHEHIPSHHRRSSRFC